MNVKLSTKHYLELLSLKEGCTASSDSTLVKIPIVGKHMSRLQYMILKKGIETSVFRITFLHNKVRKREKIRNRYNQAPHLTQDTNGKVTTSKLDITNDSQEVNPFPAGDHKASTNICA